LNLKNLNDKKFKEIASRFLALKNLDDEMKVNSAWETITDNIKSSVDENLGYYKLRKL
jgi:uncharacterized protein YeeX (DUF496 family)